MGQTPWMTHDWFVSPWNFLPEVRAAQRFAPQIRIHDVTLRDGEQQAGVVFAVEDKIRIAEALAEVGVHRIEAGMPAVSPADESAVRDIVKRNLGPQIFAFSRCMVDDVKRAVDCGVSGVVMEIPSSRHIIEHAYRWPLERAIDLSVQATSYAHEQGLEVVFFPIDLTRAELVWALDLITNVARNGHMDALGLVDTFGVCSPHAMQYLVRQVKSRVNVRLEAHFHMDFGLGVANTIMAVAEGVEVVHTTVLGLGERAGNTPMEETVLALLTMYGIDLGLDYGKLYKLASLVQECSRQLVPTNKPVVGSGLFKIESGIIAAWLRNCGDSKITEVFPYRPEFVGQEVPEVVMGKGSGMDSIEIWLSRMGIDMPHEQAVNLLSAVKEFSVTRKRLLTDQEVREIAEGLMASGPRAS